MQPVTTGLQQAMAGKQKKDCCSIKKSKEAQTTDASSTEKDCCRKCHEVVCSQASEEDSHLDRFEASPHILILASPESSHADYRPRTNSLSVASKVASAPSFPQASSTAAGTSTTAVTPNFNYLNTEALRQNDSCNCSSRSE